MLEFSFVFLFILFLGMFFVLLSLFIYLIILKYVHNETRKKIDYLKEAYRLDMFHFLQSGQEGSLQPDGSQEKFIALIELLNEYANVLDSDDVKSRISDFAKEHLTTYIKRELKKRRWSLRMNALYAIEDFYMDHLLGLLHELYEKKNVTSSEKFQMLTLFARFEDKKVVGYVKTVDPSISNFTLFTILSLMREKYFDVLVKDFDELPKRTQYIVIETIGNKQYYHHHSLLQRVLEDKDEEMRIRTLKAYANTGVAIDDSLLNTFFHSSSWQIRMMAVKVAGVRRSASYLEKLVYLLSDREYVVRSEAAKAILQFKGGLNVLRKVISDSNDEFAKDMAREWIEKESVDYY